MIYDILIIGGGISGIRVGIEILKQYPHLSCCIAEAYHIAGGRIFTFQSTIPRIGAVQWESGAGRISTTHTRTLGLLTHYGLTTYPISGDAMYMDNHTVNKNQFSSLQHTYLTPLRSLSPDILRTHTLGEVSTMVLGANESARLFNMFPYWSEIHTVRADHALHSFDHEMKSMSGFVGCVEGLSSLIDGMMNEYSKLGGKIHYNTKATSVSTQQDNIIRVDTSVNTYMCRSCILAVPSEALKHIRGISTLPVLNHLRMNPLLRMYAVFPVSHGKSWFSGLSKIVTSDRIRFFIPIDESKGIVMISYTDGNDALFWAKKDKKKIQNDVMKHIRAMFPEHDIPEPLFFKMHMWKNGCTYWKPGSYDISAESTQSLHPFPKIHPNLFLCGESFSESPCWVESALIQADRLLHHRSFTSVLTKL